MINKTYLQSIRDLPEKWINEKTEVAIYGETIVVVNPNYTPMMYDKGKWSQIKPYNEEVDK